MIVQTMPLMDGVAVHKFGNIPLIDAADTNEEVWDGTGAYTFPAAAAAMKISSSATADDIGSTGALTVRVTGLNASWQEISQDVSMDGRTGVSIPISLIRVYRAKVLTAGTGGVNAGDIWIGTGTITTGVPAVKYAGILTGMGQTLMAIYSVPADYREAVLVGWYARPGKKTSMFATVALQVREFGGAWQTKELGQISATGSAIDYKYSVPVKIKPKSDMRVRVIDCSANTSSISAGFDLMLRQ